MARIDTHHHALPPVYRAALKKAGITEAGGRAVPDWDPEASLQAMHDLDVSTAILSVSAPGAAFLPAAADAAALARDINDYISELVLGHRNQFGFFATLPMPHVEESTAESVRALDRLQADGVVLLANNAGTYLGQDGQEELWSALDERSAVVFIHPAALPGPTIPGILAAATDFLLDTTRAAYLLVRNGIRRRYPNIRFILSHAGGFVPYASHRLALSIMSDTGRSPADSLEDFASFYFDTALSSSPSALPTLLAFAAPGHVTFGSDWPFVPVVGGRLFAAGLDNYPMDASVRLGIERTNALALFPRLGAVPAQVERSAIDRLRHNAARAVVRGAARLIATD